MMQLWEWEKMPKGTVVTLPGGTTTAEPPRRSGEGWTGLLFWLLAGLVRPAGLPLNALAFLLGRVSILGEVAPFGLAFAAAVAQGARGRAPAVAVWALAGMLSVGRYVEAGLYVAAALLYVKAADRLTRQQLKLQAVPLYVFAAVALGGGLLLVWQQAPLYGFLLVAFDAALCVVLMYIFLAALPLLTGRPGERAATGEAVMCLVVLVAAAVAGIGDAEAMGFGLRAVAGGLAVMMLAFAGGPGLGAAAGVAVGTVAGLEGGGAPLMISVFGIAGLLAATFRSLGKLAVIAGFLLGSAIAVLMLAPAAMAKTLAEAAVGAAVFAALPMEQLRGLSRGLREQAAATQTAAAPGREAALKLAGVADIFAGMATSLGRQAAEEGAKVREEETARLLAAVGERVCGPCRRRGACWDGDYQRTSQAMLAALAAADKARLTGSGLPEPLNERCERARELAEAVNAVAERNRALSFWDKQAAQIRRLSAEQMKAMGAILGDLAGELTRDRGDGGDPAANLRERAAMAGCPLGAVRLEEGDGRRRLTATKQLCRERRECMNVVLPLAAAALGEQLTLAASCGDASRREPCRLTMEAAGRYRVATGWASAAKEGVSGDTAAVLPLPAGKVALVLSDGMGTGRRAAGDSMATVRYLQRLLAAGFAVEVAVKTVNSLLLLKLPEETFTTVDMAVIDLAAGEAEFLKVGAAPSFVKRVREVATVQAASLPAGIVQQVEIEPVRWLLAPGDIIVMVSDGVVEVPGRAPGRETWVANFLRRMPDGEPQELAEQILRQATDLAGPRLRDDMTVLVAKVTEKPGLGG